LITVLAMCSTQAFAQTRPADDALKLQVDALGKQMENGPDPMWDYRSFPTLVKALSELPAADDRRLAALAVAGRYARAAELSAQAKTNGEFRRDHFRLNAAWEILRSFRVIREGASVEDLVPILGVPTQKYRGSDGVDTWRWYYLSPMHVNPSLDVKVKDGVVVASEINRA
jgi:hypothetical protein